MLADILRTEFIKYNSTYGGGIEGKVSAELGDKKVNTDLTLSGKDSSKLQSVLGSLTKEEVDMQKLLRDCKDRYVPSAFTSCLVAAAAARRPETQQAACVNFV